MNNRHIHSQNDDHNLFLTATSSHQSEIKSKFSHYSPTRNHMTIMEIGSESHQVIKNSILVLIREFKALRNAPEISHLFNQILYGLDGGFGERKNIQKITELLENERNLIKLNRVWNRLKALKKQFDRLGLEKKSKLQTRTSHAQKFSNPHIYPLTTSNTIHRTATTPINQLKQNIISQISYRQRLIKIQSQRQKHESNRQKFIQKKLTKTKEMNKKVKEVFEKNRNMQKEQFTNHKYEVLYDPEEERLKKRGKTVNCKTRVKDDELVRVDIKRSNQRCVTLKLQNNEAPSRLQNKTKKNLKFSQKEEDKFTKQDLMTFKSLKELINPNIKGSKSFKTINNNQQNDGKYNMFTVSRPKQLYTKLHDKSLNRSHSLGKNESINHYQKPKQVQQQKINSVMNKRIQMQEQRLQKIITEAVNKQKRIIQIYERRNQSKAKKSDEDSQQDLGLVRSVDSSPNKTLFKRVYTRKQLLDKEKKIFADIENKLQKKEHFLQERVQRVRDRLKKQEQKKERHKQQWDEYIQFSQNVSMMNSRNASPSMKGKENFFKHQQKIVKNSHFSKLKKMKSNIDNQKLAGLTMQELKKKLAEIDAEQEEKKNQQRMVF